MPSIRGLAFPLYFRERFLGLLIYLMLSRWSRQGALLLWKAMSRPLLQNSSLQLVFILGFFLGVQPCTSHPEGFLSLSPQKLEWTSFFSISTTVYSLGRTLYNLNIFLLLSFLFMYIYPKLFVLCELEFLFSACMIDRCPFLIEHLKEDHINYV